MKQIGLVTYYNSDNYGAMLQAYALKTEIEKNNCECTIISHDRFSAKTNEFQRNDNNHVNRWKFGQLVKGARLVVCKYQKSVVYEKERTRIKCSKFRDECFPKKTEVFYYSTKQILEDPPMFDGYVCGSDQIWNPERIEGSEPFYLAFAPEGRNRISYAPSIGTRTIPSEYTSFYQTYISMFDSLSVREKSGCQAIYNMTSIMPECVLDPTFLLSYNEWIEFSDADYNTPDEYILCYFLGKENLIRNAKVINSIAKRMNCKVVVLPYGMHCADKRWLGPTEVGPKQFVKLIKDAKYVLTDSFHGTSLSILLKKDFNVFSGDDSFSFANRFDRIKNILDISCLGNRMYKDCNDIDLSKIDHDAVQNIMYPTIIKSKEFLTNALNKVEKNHSKHSKVPHLASYESCTGCSSCISSCADHAITMKADKAGFWRPVIDEEKCIKCGKCERKCPVRNPIKNEGNFQFYAIYANDKEFRRKGSSGNAFGLFANQVLKEGGDVFGAVLSDNCRELYFDSASNVGMNKLQKSKYFEADMRNTIERIEKLLAAGKTIMFTGTPCQAAGIRKYFGKNDKLLICDFICHGVSSSYWFGKYLSRIEEQYQSKATSVSFRSKRLGWRLYCMLIEFANGKHYLKTRYADPYYIDFFRNKHLRTNCYCCNRIIHSCADITFGDYWACNTKHNIEDTDEGVSVVRIGTQQGEKYLLSIPTESMNIIHLSEQDVDETFVYRMRKKPDDCDILPDTFNMHPHLNIKQWTQKVYYEGFVRHWN